MHSYLFGVLSVLLFPFILKADIGYKDLTMEHLRLDGNAGAHVDAYFEYTRIVGDADGGKLLSEKDYEEFKKKARQHRANRLYVTWQNMDGVDCKTVGPSTQCFCQHRYRDHATDNSQSKKVHCKVSGCQCKLFDYIPSHGTWMIKCSCKHDAADHQAGSRKCRNCRCNNFTSSYSCSCGYSYDDHKTIFETREERVERGKPVDNLGGGGAGYEAMGGLTNFSSLADGIDRMAIGDGGNPQLVYDSNPMLEGGARTVNRTNRPALPPSGGDGGAPNPLALLKRKHSLGSGNSGGQGGFHAITGPSASRVPSGKRLPAPGRNTQPRGVEMAVTGSATQNLTPEEMQALIDDPVTSQAKKYALKKQLALEKANRIKAERKAAQERERMQQMGDGYY